MLGIIHTVFTFIRDWADVFLIAVGLSAMIVYIFQKRDKKRSAATLILGQIDSIEEKIGILKNGHQLNNVVVYHSKTIISENTWEKYKHLFAKELSQSEHRMIQNFFDTAEQLERTRADIVMVIKNAWADKSSVEHQIIGEMIKNDVITTSMPNEMRSSKEMTLFQDRYKPLDLVFTPDIAINSFVNNLNNFTMLSGTTAYEKIQHYSFSK
ncbi:hypothetical protein [Anaerotignum faecicola]